MKPYVLIILLALLPALVRFDTQANSEDKNTPPTSSKIYPGEKPREAATPLDKPASAQKTTTQTCVGEPREMIPSRYAAWFM